MEGPHIRCALALLGAFLASSSPAAPVGSIFRPNDYKPLTAHLNPASNIVFNTGSATSAPTVLIDGVGPLTATKATSESGEVEMAVFVFNRVTLSSNVSVTVTGNRGLALLSKLDMNIAADISVDGKDGTGGAGHPPGGAGGPGAEGGAAGNTPPPDNRGDGGDTDGATPGIGLGGGAGAANKKGGGGGAYGGDGGRGGPPDPGSILPVTPGGAAYGDGALTNLVGGSGGGASNDGDGGDPGSGGGGGGALLLVTPRIMRVSGCLSARGGNGGVGHAEGGGGGSGGAVLLAAARIHFTGTIDARGGNGGDSTNDRDGGGGGGGRVAFYSANDFGDKGENRLEPIPPTGVLLSGGTSGGSATDGAPGTFYDAQEPPFTVLQSTLIVVF